jgi:protoporphyrinogen oxidase
LKEKATLPALPFLNPRLSLDSDPARSFVVIGAGPAGLTAAHDLARQGLKVTVLDRGGSVGGIARTETYKGFHFDMGGHRFFTKKPEVQQLWEEVLGRDFLKRPRLSRIYYRGSYFHYPLRPFETLRRLGPLEALRIVASTLRWWAFPYEREDTFEQWVTNRFGRRLFQTFFKTYTEKVWGLSCSELRAEWAAQRIRNLSMRALLLHALGPRQEVTSLIEAFHYPRLGPGMMWRAMARGIEDGGSTVRLGCDVVRILRQGREVRAVEVQREGRLETISGTDFVSSMPVTEFVKRLDPPAPAEVRQAAQGLRYRDFLTVCLIVDRAHLFPDNWIYVHDPGVRMARIQNFKNWSPEMVPDPGKTSLGLEYFCNEGDDLWSRADEELLDLGRRELAKVGLAAEAEVVDGCVFRVRNAYPVYDSAYAAHLRTIRSFMDGLENCRTVGRNGLHRYNNQDHSMLTARAAVRSLLSGEREDLWAINAEAEYHEEREIVDEFLEALDPVAMGGAVGAVCGAVLFLATVILLWRGGPVVGPNLALLGQLLPGYDVSLRGSLVGLGYGAAVGGFGGWAFARLRNLAKVLVVGLLQRRLDRDTLRQLLDEI